MTTSLELQEKIASLNAVFLDNMSTIEAMQQQLLKTALSMNLSNADLADAQEYIQDKVTLFRFLKDAKFNKAKALEKLETVLAWRIDQRISRLSFKDCIAFFGGNDDDEMLQALTFFHQVDNSGHFPLVFVRLAHFPSLKKLYASSSSSSSMNRRKKLVDHVQPFACFVMEMARKLTWDMTKDRMRRGERYVLVAEIMALVNVSKAPILPIDAELIKAMSVILDHRFPGMVDSIHVFNFNWVYQGLWSILRYLLSEDAKKSIHFDTIDSVQSIISPDRILTEMGGTDDFLWSVSNDYTLQKYGTGKASFYDEKEVEREEAAVQQQTSRLSNAAFTITPATSSDIPVSASRANCPDNSPKVTKQALKPFRAVAFARDSPRTATSSSSKSERSDSSSENDLFFDAINDSTNSSPSLSVTTKQVPQKASLAQQLPPSPPLSVDIPPPSETISSPLPALKPHNFKHQSIPAPHSPFPRYAFQTHATTTIASPPSMYSVNHGLRSGTDVLTSFISKRRRSLTPVIIQQHDRQSTTIPPPSATTATTTSPATSLQTHPCRRTQQRSLAPITTEKHDNDTFVITIHLQELQHLLKHYTNSLFQYTIGHRGLVYWALLYLFLRGPVEGFVHRSVMSIFQMLRRNRKDCSFNHVRAATMGITATVAAAMSTGVSFALVRFGELYDSYDRHSNGETKKKKKKKATKQPKTK